ncbi:hypothetical protein Tco_1243007, partial [Tanacetum coccineum]
GDGVVIWWCGCSGGYDDDGSGSVDSCWWCRWGGDEVENGVVGCHGDEGGDGVVIWWCGCSGGYDDDGSGSILIVPLMIVFISYQSALMGFGEKMHSGDDMPLLRTITDIVGQSIWFKAIVALNHVSFAPLEDPKDHEESLDAQKRCLQLQKAKEELKDKVRGQSKERITRWQGGVSGTRYDVSLVNEPIIGGSMSEVYEVQVAGTGSKPMIVNNDGTRFF